MKYLCIALALMMAACSTPDYQYQAEKQLNDLNDDDLDGVINHRDLCAETPLKAVTDNNGCPVESDKYHYSYSVINFGYDQDRLTLASRTNVQLLSKRLKRLGTGELYLIGDTSEEGTIEYNRKLAQRRINAVKQALAVFGTGEVKIKEESFEDTQNIPQDISGRYTRVVAVIKVPRSTDVEMQFDVYNATQKY